MGEFTNLMNREGRKYGKADFPAVGAVTGGDL